MNAALTALPTLSVLLATGADARTYLQGQLSLDLEQLTPATARLASVNSAQGRVQALPWLIERQDGIALLLPTELLQQSLARLRKFILRAKVQINVADDRLRVFGRHVVSAGDAFAHRQDADKSIVNWPGPAPRELLIAPPSTDAIDDSLAQSLWHLDDIRAGLPQIHTQTHEAFVAQMLNVDLLGGISYEKGCYTGQEIIARTHFRGTVKRRMLRFAAKSAAPAPGARVLANGQHAGDVVTAANTADGCELLAVISLAQREQGLTLESGETLAALPMPYSVE